MAAIPPDYDTDPGRWRSWHAPRDVHEVVAPELEGPVLDIGCGEGRLAECLTDGIAWVGVDSSPRQLRENPTRPVVLADMETLPFRDNAFAEVAHLWCLYHVAQPRRALSEAYRVLFDGGHYYASTAARDSDPEIVPGGYAPSSFDAEEAVPLVGSVFSDIEAERWNDKFYALETREEIVAYCRHNGIPVERAECAALPLWLTKRGVLVRATKRAA